MADDAGASGAPPDVAALKAELIALMPSLRAYARFLTANTSNADDLVQEALLKGLGNLHRFEVGSNMRAWMFTILRNTYFSALRKTRRIWEDADGEQAARLGEKPSQDGAVDLEDFKRAFAQLSDEHREVLTLVGVAGVPYEEAAQICNCAVGTVKSRVNRARAKLGELLGLSPDEFASDPGGGGLPAGVLTKTW